MIISFIWLEGGEEVGDYEGGTADEDGVVGGSGCEGGCVGFGHGIVSIAVEAKCCSRGLYL